MAHLFTTAPITGHSLYKSQGQAKCVFFYWRWYQSAFVMNKRSQLPLSTAAAGSSADHTAGTSAEYLWCVGSSCCSALGETMIREGEKHAPMWCLWVKWTAGQAVIANDSSQVHRGHVCEWFSYLFPQQANPLQESRIRHLWERLVFISRRHLPRHTFCWGKNGKDSEDGEVFSKVVTEKISHHSQHFLLPQRPSFWFLSLFIHSIFNLSHKAHYSYVPAAIAVRLSELLAIHSTPLQYP